MSVGILTALLTACGSNISTDPVEVISKIPFHGGISVENGEDIAFGAASIKSNSNIPVTNISAILIPEANVEDSIVEIFAVETENHNLPEILVTKWDTASTALDGFEVPLNEYSLTESAGPRVNIIFKVRANGLGRSDWSGIQLSYDYEGKKYSQTIPGSLSLCTPNSADCR